MATVTTTIAPGARQFALAGYSAGSATGYHARGICFFNANNEPVLLSGVGDNQRILINFTLPRNFAYSLECLSVGLTASTAAGTCNFGSNAKFQMNDAVTGADRKHEIVLGAFANGAANNNSTNLETKQYKLWNHWCHPVIPASSADSIFTQFDVFNETANDGAYSLDIAASFLQYDISQVYNTGVNSPLPVRG